MMYGQMTAGSWIYIGTQGIVQGTYETFAEMGRQHYGGDSGEVDSHRRTRRHGRRAAARRDHGRRLVPRDRVPPLAIEFRLRTGYVDVAAKDLDDALAIIARSTSERKAGLGRAARQRRGDLARASAPRRQARHRDRPDLRARSRQRLPAGGLDACAVGGAPRERSRGRRARRQGSMADHVRAMLAYAHAGVPTVDYGNNIRQMALEEGVADAFDFPGFVPAYIRPLFCRGVGPFRWAALSGDPEDIYRTDAKVKELMPGDAHLHNWLDMARERIRFQGCRRASAGSASATGTGSAWPSTRWSRRANSRRRSSSAAITSIPAPSPRPTARPRRCGTARTPCPTGRCSTRC